MPVVKIDAYSQNIETAENTEVVTKIQNLNKPITNMTNIFCGTVQIFDLQIHRPLTPSHTRKHTRYNSMKSGFHKNVRNNIRGIENLPFGGKFVKLCLVLLGELKKKFRIGIRFGIGTRRLE